MTQSKSRGAGLTFTSYLWIIVLSFAFCISAQPSKAEDSSQSQWTTTGNLLAARIEHTATLLSNGKVLIVGGWGGSEELASVELYEPREGLFTRVADLGTGRTNHTATLLSNGQVLVVGGQFHGNTLASAELYNPATGTWTNTGNLHIARSYHTATLLANGQVLVVGGTHWASPPVFSPGAPPGSALDIAELYDPASGKWTVTDSLHTARYVHTATLLRNGQVLVVGGLSAKGAADVLASAELYNPNTRAWSVTGSLPTALLNQTATLLPNGKVLVAGGQHHGIIVPDAELYDPSSGVWMPTANLQMPTNGQTATLLTDGQVMIAGGVNDPTVLTTVELYNPETGTWRTTASMDKARGLHTATLLSDGRVLVTGGGYAVGSPAFVEGSAELYCVGTEAAEAGTQKPASDDGISASQSRSEVASSSSPLVNLAACLTIFAACLVILTACVVLLLSVGFVFVLIQRWRK